MATVFTCNNCGTAWKDCPYSAVNHHSHKNSYPGYCQGHTQIQSKGKFHQCVSKVDILDISNPAVSMFKKAEKRTRR